MGEEINEERRVGGRRREGQRKGGRESSIYHSNQETCTIVKAALGQSLKPEFTHGLPCKQYGHSHLNCHLCLLP